MIKIFLVIGILAVALGLTAWLPLFATAQPAAVQAASDPLRSLSPANSPLAFDLQQQSALTATLTPTEYLQLAQFFTATREISPVLPVVTIGSEVMTLTALTDPFWSAAFLPAGVRVAEGDADHTPANFFELINAEPPPESEGVAPPSIQAGLSIFVSIETGSGGAFLFNGSAVTYTLTVVNDGPDPAQISLIADKFPQGRLVNLTCLEPCHFVVQTDTITTPFGSPLQITRTIGITWPGLSLETGASVSKTFFGRVICQAEGSAFINSGFVFSNKGNPSKNLSTPVQARLDIPGQGNFSGSPTWCSDDTATGAGGTLSQDWGDFDRDGDLDLVLGSTLGKVVYENEQGQLIEFWSEPGFALGVAWADVISTSQSLELVVVGESVPSNSPTQPGRNYIYSFEPGAETFVLHDTFASELQIFRVAPGDYDKDGDIDLTLSINALASPSGCFVVFYGNPGDGHFPDIINPDPFPPFPTLTNCISIQATASLSPADYDNDKNLDLALGLLNCKCILVLRTLSVMPNPFGCIFCNISFVDDNLSFIPYDVAWGDYDGDGNLDLAAAFPFEKKVQIYRNLNSGPFCFFFCFEKIQPAINTTFFLTPLAVDWGDFNRDGILDLAVADAPPKIYSSDDLDTPILALPSQALPNQGGIWSIRAIDVNSDADLDLALSNQFGASLLFSMFAAPLNTQATPTFAPFPANSLAWGDVVSDTGVTQRDGYVDLLVGASVPLFNPTAKSGIHYYRLANAGFLPISAQFEGLGEHTAAFGDEDRDYLLDVALVNENVIQIYRNPNWSAAPIFEYANSDNQSLAWGDADNNNEYCLDLLVGTAGANLIFFNRAVGAGCALETTPGWTSPEVEDTRSVAWGDYNNDRYLDFAVGNAGQPNRIYRNNKNKTFSLAQSLGGSKDTRSVAWGDWDQDGDLDLAVGNYGTPNAVYVNTAGIFAEVQITAAASKTTSVAWGDWEQDGDLDLAVGNEGEPNQVYANLGTPGAPQFIWLWTSAQSYQTTSLAWGDKDGDGDLDLAFSQNGNLNGVYENNHIRPTHLTGQSAHPLANNPSYLSVARPGQTSAAYFYSSAEMLLSPVVTIPFIVYDLEGDNIIADKTKYEFRLNGTGVWQPATPSTMLTIPTPISRGVQANFAWNALQNQAVSDYAQFRITIVNGDRAGRVQQASSRAVSPPFRVRALNKCVWPDNPLIIAQTPYSPGLPIHFVGTVSEGDGLLTFSWEFGDGITGTGQSIFHTYPVDNTYPVTLSVRGEPCPVTNEVLTTKLIPVGTGILVYKIYLPLISKGSNPPTQEQPPPAVSLPGPIMAVGSATSVLGLQGRVDTEAGTTQLTWQPNPASENILGYHIYRAARADFPDFQRVATVAADTTLYPDPTTACGAMYLLTAFNPQGESQPSPVSYFSPRCQ